MRQSSSFAGRGLRSLSKLSPSLSWNSLPITSLATQKRFISESRAARPHVTIIPGDGIGQETVNSVLGIWYALDVPITWDLFANKGNYTEADWTSQELINSIATTGVALKGVFLTQRSGPESLNVRIRKALDLYAGVCRIQNLKGIKGRFPEKLDIAFVRENTEGEYSGVEHVAAPGVHQSMKIMTSTASLRVARYAFEYATANGRKKVTAVHKANIQKQADGLFLECCREVQKEFPDITYEEMIVDNASMQMVMRPDQFDVVLTPNLYGAILSNIAAGLIGGSGVVPGFVEGGRGIKLFEPGSRHVSLDIAGKNLANPVAMILSSVKLLRSVGLGEYGDKIEAATRKAMEDPKNHTEDIGGTATTTQVTKAIIDLLAK